MTAKNPQSSKQRRARYRSLKCAFLFHPLFLLLLVLLVSSLAAQGVCAAAGSAADPITGEEVVEEDHDDYYAADDDYAYNYQPVDTTIKVTKKMRLSNQRKPTEHQKVLRDTHIDFSGANLTGDPATAAAQATKLLEQQILRRGRLKKLFQDAKTPECRAMIAEHFSHFVMALALEEPLPFVEIEFANTCNDEEAWDFNNLPEGVHMGVSLHCCV